MIDIEYMLVIIYKENSTEFSQRAANKKSPQEIPKG
jgi:hypothetical protein